MDDLQRIVRVARMYYQQGLKQEEIARRVKVSRASISVLLSEARKRGIVEITIRNPLEDNAELSREISSAFGVTRCVVVPASVRETETLIDLASARAAGIFDQEAKTGDVVGVAWGRTCQAFMSHYAPRRLLHGLQVVPLIGGSDRTLQRYQLNEMVRAFAEKLQATPAFIHAPALAASRKDFELYMGSSSMKAILEMWRATTIAVVSVGAPPVAREMDGSRVPARRRKSAPPEALPIGDICARYFDVKGRFVEDELSARIIGIPVESLRRIPKVLCVAAGLEKAYSLLGALKTGCVTILVTDERTATALLDARREDESGQIGRSVARLYGRA
ncbi:MAG TPA: sugar-binding domain-containing protein, partial [Spirochaetia bacterium]|nr:sugar-binding domain-containing protein [Spirochaetia bacterium]